MAGELVALAVAKLLHFERLWGALASEDGAHAGNTGINKVGTVRIG